MWLPPMSTERAPTFTLGPITQPGPMCAVESTCADEAILAAGSMPDGGASSGGKNNGSTRATATRAFGTRIKTFVSEVNGPDTRMAAAALAWAARKYG